MSAEFYANRFFIRCRTLVLLATVLFGSNCSERTARDENRLAFVEGGTFVMGNDHSLEDGLAEGSSTDTLLARRLLDETPAHAVTVNSFWIGKYEATQKEWTEVMGSCPSGFAGDDLPVETVSWYDAVEYCNARSLKEGLKPCYAVDKANPDPDNHNFFDDLKWTVVLDPDADGYRLPTEAEWEFAARGGRKSKGTKYAGSDNVDEVAEYAGNNNVSTRSVGGKKPNELGLYDMSGSVWEWCWDRFEKYPGNAVPDEILVCDPSFRVLRGGAWDYPAVYCRVSNRTGHGANLECDHYGFRVARSAK